MPRKLTNDEVIARFYDVHGDRYDYSLVEYINNRSNIKIVCPVHGVFEQTPYNHTKGSGCPECSYEKKSDDNDRFIAKAKGIQGEWYNYSRAVYVNTRTKVEIICPVHGSFWQTPTLHLNKNRKGCGCPQCWYEAKTSQGELDLRNFIQSIYTGPVSVNSRGLIFPYEIDIYLPEKRMAFEYNGNYWHLEGVNKPVGYHDMKTDMCGDAGVQLFHIWEDDWLDKPHKIMHNIKNILSETTIQC